MAEGNISSGGGGAIPLTPPIPDLDAGTAVVKVSGTTTTVTINDVLTTSSGQTEDQTTSYTLDPSQATPIPAGSYALSQLVTFANGTYGSANTGNLLDNEVATDLNMTEAEGNTTTGLSGSSTISNTTGTNATGTVSSKNSLTGTGGTGNPYLAANPIVAIAIAMEIMYSTMRRSQLETGLTSIKESQVALSLAQCAATLTLAGAQADAAGDVAQGAAALASGIVAGVMAMGTLAGAASADYDGAVTNGEGQVGADEEAEENYEDDTANGENVSSADSKTYKAYADAEKSYVASSTAVDDAQAKLNDLENANPPDQEQISQAQKDLQQKQADKAWDQKARDDYKAKFDETPSGQKMQLAKQIQEDRAALQNAKYAQSVGEEDGAGTDPETTAANEANVKAAQEKLDADQEKLAQTDPAYKKLTDKTAADEKALKVLKNTPRDAWTAEKIKSSTHMQQAFGQVLSSIPTAVGDFLKANFTLESASAKARGQIVESYSQMVTQLMTALSKSYDTSGDAMKSIMDALNSIMQSTAQSSGIQKA